MFGSRICYFSDIFCKLCNMQLPLSLIVEMETVQFDMLLLLHLTLGENNLN